MKTRLYLIIIAFFLTSVSVRAQESSLRLIYEQAEEEYEVGRIEQARELLESDLMQFSGDLKPSVYRLLALCCLGLDETHEAERYTKLLLREVPNYASTIQDTQRFSEMVNSLKRGYTSTISTASNQNETIEEAPSPVTIITAEMIEELGYNKNLNQILAAYVPGMVEISSHTPEENLAMHGAYAMGQELILIMENGHRLNNHYHNVGTTSYSISTEKIDHIEVLRGPASSLYGNVALSAVVNIITKTGREINGVKARYGYGSYNTHRGDLLMGTRFMDADIAVWASIYKSDGQIRHFTDGAGYYSSLMYNRTVSDGDIHAYYGPNRIYVGSYRDTPAYDVGLTLKLKGFDLMFSRKNVKKLYQIGSGCGYDYSLYAPIDGIKPGYGTEENHAEIGYTNKIGKFTISALVYGDWQNVNDYQVQYDKNVSQYPVRDEDYNIVYDEDGNIVYEDPEEYTGQYYYDSFKETTIGGYLKTSTDYRLGQMKGNLLGGCQFEHFSIHSRNFFMGGDFKFIEYGVYNYEKLTDSGKENNLSFFLQDKHYFLPQLIMNAGFRFDIKHRKEDHLTAFSPRLAIMYVPSDMFSLKLSYSKAFADLAFYYRYIANDEEFQMSPQRLSAVQLTAMGKNRKQSFNYEVNLFYNKYTNLCVWHTRLIDANNSDYYKNSGILKTLGIEGSANYYSKRLSGNLSFYYCHDLSAKNCYNNESEKIVTGVPHLTLNLHGAWKMVLNDKHELKLYGHSSYTGRKMNYTLIEENDFYVGEKLLFDIGIKYSYRQRLNFSIDCENILNTDNYLCGPDDLYHPIFQRGRSLMASISYRF